MGPQSICQNSPEFSMLDKLGLVRTDREKTPSHTHKKRNFNSKEIDQSKKRTEYFSTSTQIEFSAIKG
jgi:hypothetical protein